MPQLLKIISIFVVFFALGWLVASDSVVAWFSDDKVYFSAEGYSQDDIEAQLIGWQALLGETDRLLMTDLQDKQLQIRKEMAENQDESFQMDAQLVESVLKAETWQSLDGYELNNELAGQHISIPGFVVPLESERETLYSFFIVPYFGACLHFPPPPPNQLIYVQYEQGIPLPSIDTPFIFEGVLQAELFEDLMGTSAWSMEIGEMRVFDGDADPTRLHR